MRRDLRALERQDLTVGQLAAALEAQEARVLGGSDGRAGPAHAGKSWRVLRKHDRSDDDGDD